MAWTISLERWGLHTLLMPYQELEERKRKDEKNREKEKRPTQAFVAVNSMAEDRPFAILPLTLNTCKSLR